MTTSDTKINSNNVSSDRFRIQAAVLAILILSCPSSYGFKSASFDIQRRLKRHWNSIPALKRWKPQMKMDSDVPHLPDLSSIVYGCDDVLFGHIEKMEMLSSRRGDFGSFLDAGTGSHSLRWIASILHRTHKHDLHNAKLKVSLPVSMTNYTAVTADLIMQKNVMEEAKNLGIDTFGKVVIGNWDDSTGSPSLCENELFDTILADYLVGAIDGFSPYFQDLIFPRLCNHLKPGGRLYIVGLNPIPDKADGDGHLICKVTKLRDACILLAGHRCYREYPYDWIERHVKSAGLRVLDTSKFPILYSQSAIKRQLDVARSKLRLFSSKALADEMVKEISALEKECELVTSNALDGRIKLGFDYVVVAEK